MKNSVIFLLMLTFCCSCDKGVSGGIGNTLVVIVIVDEAFNDRLNPESPAYFGNDYTRSIEVLYLCDGQKLTYLGGYYAFTGGGSRWFIDDVEKNHKTISTPGRALNYYYIDCTSRAVITEADKKVTYTYIRYPDGSEDEIKVQIRTDLVVIDHLWINGELVFSFNTGSATTRYYNPKYYPWLLPVYDDKGNQSGVIPKQLGMVVITK